MSIFLGMSVKEFVAVYRNLSVVEWKMFEFGVKGYTRRLINDVIKTQNEIAKVCVGI